MPARRTAGSGCLRPRSRRCPSAVPGESWRRRAAGMTSKLEAVTMTSRMVVLTSWVTSRSRAPPPPRCRAAAARRDRYGLLRPSLGGLRQASVAREAPDDDDARQALDDRAQRPADQAHAVGLDARQQAQRSLAGYPRQPQDLADRRAVPRDPCSGSAATPARGRGGRHRRGLGRGLGVGSA